MAITITINGSVTLDETAGTQVGGSATTNEDNNDSDISLATLQTDASSFYARLNTLLLDPDGAFGFARSANNYIALSGTGTITSLGFTNASGGVLPVLGSGTGAACNLTALDGGAITLFQDASLGSSLVYGVDSTGDIVFAMYMKPNAGLTAAEVWMVQFEPMDNPVDTNHDDPLAMTGLGVGAGVSSEFNFAGLPSGQNLFGMVGSTTSALIVIGKTPVLNPDGTFTNASNTINTSQGGGNTTIGVNNQMFDPGEGAYFTYVRHAVSNFIGTNLDAGEADNANNMQYTDGDNATNDTIEVDSAFLKVAQLQGGGLATMSIAAFNIDGSPQGDDLIPASGDNPVAITRVVVYAADGTTVLEDSSLAGPQNANIVITFGTGTGAGGNGIPVGVVRISGVDAKYKIEWFTDGVHDQVLVSGVAGKFDIGGFGINEPSGVSVPLTGVRFEDDGPAVNLVLNGSAELRVDESTLPVSDSVTAADLFSTNTASFGTDGAGTDDSVYDLLLGDPNSGLFDTATGDEVILSINGDGTLITGEVNDGVSDVTVFTIAIDPDTGEVTLQQERAMVNGDPTDEDESDTPLTLDADTVGVRRTVTDGDDDSASDSVDISAIFLFEDDGPTQPPVGEPATPLLSDDSDITDLATLSTDDIFPGAPDFGNDGPHAITPIDFTLRLVTENGNSGLVDTATGKAILLKTVGSDVVGYVDSNGNNSIDVGETLEAVRYSLTVVDSDTELVNFTQTRSVVHSNVNDPDEAGAEETITANLVLIDRIAKDGDGDVSEKTTFDLGAFTLIRDDGPSIGPISDGLVDFAINDFVTNSLNGAVGNDPNSAPYIVTAYTQSLTAGNVALEAVLAGDSQSVTYYADTNGNDTFGDAGDTAFYRLTLNQAGAGTYTFTVLADPPPDFTEFDFTYLPSGQSLFGVLVDEDENGVQDLDGLGLLVVGRDAVINDPGNGSYTNASDTINTSQGGGAVTIGVDNQMFDPGDGAIFVYLDNPDDKSIAINPETGSGGLTQTSADDADTLGFAGTVGSRGGEIEVVQKQGGGALGMRISAYDVDVPGADNTIVSANDPQSNNPPTTDDVSQEARDFIEDPLAGGSRVSITTVNVYDRADPTNILESVVNVNGTAVNVDGDGDGVIDNSSITVTFTLVGGVYVATVLGFTANDTIAWGTAADHDAVLIEGTSGKWDVGGFNLTQGNDTPDQLLEFTAQVTDGDGDTDSASWKIGIDGTGQYDDNMVSGVVI